MKLDNTPFMDKKRTLLLAAFLPMLAYAVRALHAATLDPDEVDCWNLAHMHIAGRLKWLAYDSYPLAYPTLLSWLPTGSDAWCRADGLLVQAWLCFAVWRLFGAFGCLPRFTLAALALPCFVHYTGNLRAWGLGCVFLLEVFRSVHLRHQWRLLFWSLLACHATYHDCVLVGCTLVWTALSTDAAERRAYAAVLAVCALSMVLYLPAVLGERSHYHNLHVHFGLADFWARLGECWRVGWAPLLLAVAAYLFVRECEDCRWETAGWAMALAGTWAAYFGFLYHLHYRTDVWYYLPLVLATAVALDFRYPEFARWQWAAWLAVMVSLSGPAFAEARKPATGMGPALAGLRDHYRPGDLVVVSPWETAIQVEHYCPGVPFETVPPGVTNNLCHRYDLEARYVDAHPEPDAAWAFRHVCRALDERRRVWILSNAGYQSYHPDPGPRWLYEATHPNLAGSFYWSVLSNERLAHLVQDEMVRRRLTNCIPIPGGSVLLQPNPLP